MTHDVLNSDSIFGFYVLPDCWQSLNLRYNSHASVQLKFRLNVVQKANIIDQKYLDGLDSLMIEVEVDLFELLDELRLLHSGYYFLNKYYYRCYYQRANNWPVFLDFYNQFILY